MNFWELIVIAVGLSMDAFAVAICKGLSIKRIKIKHALIVGAYFGFFQGAMPVIGYLVAAQFSHAIVDFDHWIVFALLSIIGTKMIIEAFEKDEELQSSKSSPLAFMAMLPLALATSVDALAVGISFAFLNANIIFATLLIALTTLTLSAVGVKIGNAFGVKYKSKAELLGGIVLILMGIKILIEHLVGF